MFGEEKGLADVANDEIIKAIPFAASIGIELTLITPEQVVGRLSWSQDRTTAGGAIHGGATMALADTIAAICAVVNLPPGATTTTTASSTVFVRAARSGTIIATARPIHVGRSTIVLVIEVRDDVDKLIAQTTQTQAILASSE